MYFSHVRAIAILRSIANALQANQGYDETEMVCKVHPYRDFWDEATPEFFS